MQNADLPVELYCEFALKRRETFGQSRVVMFAHDTGACNCDQLGDRAALLVLPRKFENLGVLACNWVFPYLSDLDWSAIARTVWIGVPHAFVSNRLQECLVEVDVLLCHNSLPSFGNGRGDHQSVSFLVDFFL